MVSLEPAVVTSLIPPAAVFLPLLGAFAALPLGRISERARVIGLAAVAAATAALTLAVIPGVLAGTVYEAHLVRLTPEIWIHLRIDALGALFGATVSVLWLIALVYSEGYMRDGHRLGRYYPFFMLCLGWTLGVAYSGNLLTFLIFYELFSILTYPLIVHEETPEAIAAGTKYIIYILVGGSIVLIGVVFTFFLAGEQTFVAGGILDASADRTSLLLIFWCFVAGFGVKAALVPLHGWVPDAHPAAPAPFSAVLSGVMVAAGSFGITRVVFQVFGVDLLLELGVMPLLTAVAAFTVLFAAVLAVGQDDLKRRLAYSTISQMGYVALGIGLLGVDAVTGALVHISNHAFMKGTLFLCAGLFIKRLGIRRVSEMAGVARRMPVTTAAFALASLGMIGTPPLSGFISKWYLGLGALEAQQPLQLAVLLGGAMLAAVYLLPVVYSAFFKQPPPVTGTEDSGAREAPLSMLVPTVIAASLTIVLGLAAAVPGLPYSLARLATETFFR
ncbi:MAG TPA: proton-conducting transporter membrane subunit [Coriobacteriia bacterium]|nr:proton-conducting transporter membrane subunit [Coriobacteriia bacterium]